MITDFKNRLKSKIHFIYIYWGPKWGKSIEIQNTHNRLKSKSGISIEFSHTNNTAIYLFILKQNISKHMKLIKSSLNFIVLIKGYWLCLFTCSCDCCQNLLITPTIVNVNWPIDSQNKHDQNDNWPKSFGEKSSWE